MLCVNMYSVRQAAEKIGVRRQSVYRKLKREELSGHLHDTEKGKAITEEGIEILRTLIELSEDSAETVAGQFGDSTATVDGQEANRYIKSLEEQLLYLKGVIAEKDKQIEGVTRLAENNQRLLAFEKEKVLLLEEKNKQSWWTRLFRG